MMFQIFTAYLSLFYPLKLSPHQETADPLVLPFDFSMRPVNLQQVFRPAVLSQLFKGEKECEHLPIPAFPR